MPLSGILKILFSVRGIRSERLIDVPPQPQVHQEQVIERKLIECGLDAKEFSVKYEDYLQSIEIVFSANERALANQFECIKRATDYEIVTFKDNALHAAYTQFVIDLHRPQMIAEATDGVKKLSLLDGFPRRASFKSLEEYARALERHCGVIRGSALKVTGEGLSFDPQREENYQKFSRLYSKLIAAIMYASAIGDLEQIGFIGNEATAVPDSNDTQPH